MTELASIRRVGSPWRCGPGIYRLPDGKSRVSIEQPPLKHIANEHTDPEKIADLHRDNKLKWHAFYQWNYAIVCLRIRRLLRSTVSLRAEQRMLHSVLLAWHQYASRRHSLRAVCAEVRRLRLCTISAIWELCQRFRVFSYRTALLVFAVRFSQLSLCRRVWNVWRELSLLKAKTRDLH